MEMEKRGLIFLTSTKFHDRQEVANFYQQIDIQVIWRPSRARARLKNPLKIVNAASFGIKSKEADFFPQITANAGANRTSARFPPDQNQWDIGVGLSIPIFEGGLRAAEVKQANAVFNQAQADERSKREIGQGAGQYGRVDTDRTPCDC